MSESKTLSIQREMISKRIPSIFTRFLVLQFIFMIITFYETSFAKYYASISPPSSCGNIDIRYPFQLAGHDLSQHRIRYYDLYCENNRTVIYLSDFPFYFPGYFADNNPYPYCFPKITERDKIRLPYKYHVEAINYSNYTIRLVAPNVYQNNCSFFPSFPLAKDFFRHFQGFQAEIQTSSADGKIVPRKLTQTVTFLSCEEAVNTSSYIDTTPCLTNSVFSRSIKKYSYVVVGRDFTFSDLESSCRIEFVTLISTRKDNLKNKISSYREVHEELVYGFELSWSNGYNYGNWLKSCSSEEDSKKCHWCKFLSLYIGSFLKKVLVYIEIPRMVCVSFVVAILVYTWYNRHSSMYEGIEECLQRSNDLMPIRYSYWEIITMTKGFKEKLGEGGFGSVYKGKLPNGRLVAVKMLGKSKANGQDFMNEVATIGRIHHVNVAHLIGFCATRSKRALVYDFMSNGSLDKYIFSKEGVDKSLSCKEIFEISLGVSCGISYLHQGCDMQILHFDIKPHNILLDENFIPKISDFGLARLCPLENSIVSLTAARGTIGYIAPELFYKNIGGVSHKSDVYSFGMLLMEMANRRKNVKADAEKTSQIYFPTWIYHRFSNGNDIAMEDATEEEMEIVKKMIIVALWCIQLKPCDRPSMSKVIEMLEGEVDCLEMPPELCLYPQEQEHEIQKRDVAEETESSLSSTLFEEDFGESSVNTNAS